MSDDSWVGCDNCGKWRRITAELAATLSENEPWYCRNNPDPAYNSCEAPEELTPDEIDERTAMPVQEPTEEDITMVPSRVGNLRKKPPVWQLISKNIYTHRERKRQDEDDVMICQCKPIWATDTTTIGCGEACLNRMLNIECVPKYCPCGDRCTNQAFTKRQYAKLEVRRAGAKGFGLFAGEDMKAGQFLIEYVGEVLEEEEYMRRKEFFTSIGQRHFYFMNVGNGEVIDAARRGGLGRFINHSCAPNCETQKWVVRGELAIGLFILEDVPAGTELTFDYNFERYGDRPMKCLCATSACRGVIGGTQEAVKRVAMEPAAELAEEEEELEPIMVTERETDHAVSAILDRVVGLGWEEGWNDKLDSKLERLAASKGVTTMGAGKPRGRRKKSTAASSAKEEEESIAVASNKKTLVGAKSKKGALSSRKGSSRSKKSQKQDQDWIEDDAYDSEAEQEHEDEGQAAQQPGVSSVEGSAAGAAQHGQTSRAGSGFVIPKRVPSLSAFGFSTGPGAIPRRRSEVDRKLEFLVGASGRLRDTSSKSIVEVLRLFNLCDIGPTVSKSVTKLGIAANLALTGGAANGGAVQGFARSVSRNGAIDSRSDSEAYGGNTSHGGEAPHAQAAASSAQDRGGSSEKEEGEVSPPRTEHNLSAFAAAAVTTNTPGSTEVGGFSNGNGVAYLSANGSGALPQGKDAEVPRSNPLAPINVAAEPRYDTENRTLTARQRARLADMSLLLEVILKTGTPKAKREFVRCGVLRQLLVCIGRNVGEQYAVILRKALRAVESLPLTPDDLHCTLSAHGSFADLLRTLAHHPDYEVRNKALAVLKKWPAINCTRPIVTSEPWKHASPAMEAARSSRPPLPSAAAPCAPSGSPMWDSERTMDRDHRSHNNASHHTHSFARSDRMYSDSVPRGQAAFLPSRFGSGGGPSRPHPPRSADGAWPPPHPPHEGGSYHGKGGGVGAGALDGLLINEPSARKRSRWDAGAPGSSEPHSKGSHITTAGAGASAGASTPRLDQDNIPPSKHYRSGSQTPSYRFVSPSDGRGGYHHRERYDSVDRRVGGGGGPPPPPLPPPPPSRDAEFSMPRQQHRGGHTGGDPPTSWHQRNASPARELRAPSQEEDTWNEQPDSLRHASSHPDPPFQQHHALQHQPQERPHSALSEGEAYAPMPPPFAAPTVGGIRDAPLSPMSGEDEGDVPPPPPPPLSGFNQPEYLDGSDGAAANGRASADSSRRYKEYSRSGAKSDGGDDVWEEPDARFESFVAELVRKRVGKYEQPEHPARLRREDAGKLFKQVWRQIVAKEREAFEERRKSGVAKPIERGKLETRVKEFVRESVRRWHQRK